jgi:putative tricarboxylic transport membrane protein
MIKKDQIIGAGLVVVGIVFAAMTSRFSVPITMEYPGPKMMPAIAVFGLIVCGTGIFVQSLLSKAEEKVFLGKEGWIRLAIGFVVLVLYVLGLVFVGYLISTPIFLFVTATMFSKGKSVKVLSKVIFSVAFTLLIYLLYVQLFGLSLPSGKFF